MTLESAILDVLAGASAQKPVALFQLAGRLPGPLAPEADIVAALADLVERRAVNTARLSADGQNWRDVYWLTGVPPAPLPRGITLNKHTQADAQAAHAAQVAAEASRDELKSPPAPLLQRGEKNQENPMPRIAKPARTQAKPAKPDVIVEVHAHRRAPDGAVIAQAMAALAGTTAESALATDELLARCPAAASLGSLRATLRTLAKRGAIQTEGRTARRKLRYFWWAAAPVALNDGHEKNLAVLKRLGGEEHPAGAETRTVEPDQVAEAAATLGLDVAPGTTRYALWDDGQLLVSAGDDMIVLDAGSTRRLADFLESCLGVLP